MIITTEIDNTKIKCGYYIKKYEERNREAYATGFSWVGDQLVPDEFAGPGSESAMSYGKVTVEKKIKFTPVPKLLSVYYNVMKDHNIDNNFENKELITQMRRNLEYILLVIKACEGNTEFGAVRELIKLEKEYGISAYDVFDNAQYEDRLDVHLWVISQVWGYIDELEACKVGNCYDLTKKSVLNTNKDIDELY